MILLLVYKLIDIKNAFLRILFFLSNTNSTRYNILSPLFAPSSVIFEAAHVRRSEKIGEEEKGKRKRS